jgi:hypothetical protein
VRGPRFGREGDTALTRLAGRMLDVAESAWPGGRLRAVVMLSDPDDPGDSGEVVLAGGYAEGHLPAVLLADIAGHAGALAAAYGVPVVLAVGVPGEDIPYDEPLEPFPPSEPSE